MGGCFFALAGVWGSLRLAHSLVLDHRDVLG
jgi:hypothetical protein